MNDPPLPCDEVLAPAPAPPGEVLAPAPVLLAPPEPLADCRQPVIVTVFPESLCDRLELEPVLGVVGGCPPGEDGVCCADTPTASAALSIVPKMI